MTRQDRIHSGVRTPETIHDREVLFLSRGWWVVLNGLSLCFSSFVQRFNLSVHILESYLRIHCHAGRPSSVSSVRQVNPISPLSFSLTSTHVLCFSFSISYKGVSTDTLCLSHTHPHPPPPRRRHRPSCLLFSFFPVKCIPMVSIPRPT